MDPQLQASFIPKKPLMVGGSSVAPHSVGIVWFLAVLVFVISLGGAGSVYLYQQWLTSQITSSKTSLTKEQAAYDPAVIQNIIRLDDRITQANALIQKHTAPSGLFDFLGNTTVPGVRFTGFDYSAGIDGTGALKLTGEALDFDSVALLSDAFNNSHVLSDLLFSDVNVDATSGHVVFKITATVAPSAISYRTLLGSGRLTAGAGTPGVPVSPGTAASAAPVPASTTTPSATVPTPAP